MFSYCICYTLCKRITHTNRGVLTGKNYVPTFAYRIYWNTICLDLYVYASLMLMFSSFDEEVSSSPCFTLCMLICVTLQSYVVDQGLHAPSFRQGCGIHTTESIMEQTLSIHLLHKLWQNGTTIGSSTELRTQYLDIHSFDQYCLQLQSVCQQIFNKWIVNNLLCKFFIHYLLYVLVTILWKEEWWKS